MSVRSPEARYEFRKVRSRREIYGTPERPRLSVYRSDKHIYAQIVDDLKGRTLAFVSTLDAEVRGGKTGANAEAAKRVGLKIGEKAKALQISRVVFDRGARPYHGRVKAVADGAREAGLQF
jgi:large subunit ribosomal protein L18